MSQHRPIALVTGGGTGIGRATARALLDAGYDTILSGRRLDVLRATAADLDPAGDRAHAIAADVTEPVDVATLFDTIRSRFGRLDLLFNNAGAGTPPMPLEDLTFRQWNQVVDVNLTGSFLCIQEAFRLMKAQVPKGGRIINNGSVSAHVPRPFSVPYTATKHAITGLTRSVSLEGRPHEIACGQIDIGNAETPMTAGMKVGALQPDGRTVVEPTMEAGDIGRAVVFMASLPISANVQFMTVMATRMPYIGRG